MALVPWGGSSATTFSEPSSSPFAPNGIIYANDVNAAIRLPSLIASAVWNTLNIDDVTYNTSLDNTRTALSTTVLACGINYNSSLNKWVCPNKLSFTNGAEFNGNAEFNSAISVAGATTLSSTLNVSGITRLSSTLNVSGDTTLSKLAVNGETTFSQNTYFEGRNVGSTVYGSYYDYDNHTLKITSKSGTSDPIVTSISSTQISSSSLVVPFNSIYSSSGSESLESRLNRLGFKEGESGTDFTVPSGSPASNITLRKLGKLVIFTATVSIENVSPSAQSTTVSLITNIAEEFRPYRYPYGSTFRCTNYGGTTQFIHFNVGFNTSNTLAVRYQNTESFYCDFGSSVILSWFTEDPSNFQ